MVQRYRVFLPQVLWHRGRSAVPQQKRLYFDICPCCSLQGKGQVFPSVTLEKHKSVCVESCMVAVKGVLLTAVPSQHAKTRAGGMMQTENRRRGWERGRKERKKLTPRYLPDTTFGHTKLDVFDINCDFAFVHEEDHLHLARVLHALVTVWWNLDHARSKEWKGHNLRIAE
jgi:hypothetical protein